MPNAIDESPASQVCILVEFEYESPATYYRFAAWEEDVSFGGETFTATPHLEVKLPNQDGTVRGQDLEIKMEEVAPIDSMRGTFPPTTVTVYELDPDVEATAFKLYRGQVQRVQFNYNGNSNAVRLLVSGPKKRLETTLSLKVGRFCPWTFGSAPCTYDREANKETRTIDSIDGNKIVLTAALTETDPTWWKFGGIRYNGFEISIHRLENSTTLYTTKPVPAHWDGQSVDLLHGCEKLIEACRDRGQEANFGAMGIKLPNRDVRIASQ